MRRDSAGAGRSRHAPGPVPVGMTEQWLLISDGVRRYRNVVNNLGRVAESLWWW